VPQSLQFLSFCVNPTYSSSKGAFYLQIVQVWATSVKNVKQNAKD